MHLPRTYLARLGADARVVRAGEDVNQLVHRYYAEEVPRAPAAVRGAGDDDSDEEDEAGRGKGKGRERERGKGQEKGELREWPNYVAPEGVLAKR